jgi:uncharacterized paraquat-inducible protein A
VHETSRGLALSALSLSDVAPQANSLNRTVALVIAGAALYFPANILPIMAVGRLGRPNPDTILTGIGELVRRGYWPLAIIVSSRACSSRC